MYSVKKSGWCRMMVALCLLICGLFVFSTGASAASASKKITLMKGKSVQLRVKNTSSEVSWSSTKPSVATVSNTGLVKAVGKGKTTIKAYVNGTYYKCKVTVKQPVTSISLNKTSYFLMPGKKLTLKATVMPKIANNRKVKWSSSNKNVAKVSSSGVVTALKKGSATITAKAKDGSGVKATCKIIVLKGSATAAKPSTSTTTAASTSGSSSKAQALLNTLNRYSKIVQSETASGIAWTYNRRYVPMTFEEARTNNKRICSCSWLITWALKDKSVGVLDYRCNLSNYDNGEIFYAKSGNTKELVNQKCQIIKVNQTVKDLAKAGKLVPGDIMVYRGHNNVFAGYNKSTGEITYYDAGRIGTNGGYKNGTYHYNSFGPFKTTGALGTATYIIRIK